MVAENGRDELADATAAWLWDCDSPEEIADAILSSSWLAGQLKQARADALEEAAMVADRLFEEGDTMSMTMSPYFYEALDYLKEAATEIRAL